MKRIIFFIAFFTSTTLWADDAEIVDVFRNIPLSNEEVAYKDFYIKIDSTHPVKKNLVVKAFRKISVKDSAGKSVGDFKTEVGLLKIIQVDSKIAVARELQLTPRDSQATLEQVGIMVGDQIDFNESYIDHSSKKSSPKSASLPPQEPQRDISSAKPVENSQVPVQKEDTPPAEAIPAVDSKTQTAEIQKI